MNWLLISLLAFHIVIGTALVRHGMKASSFRDIPFGLLILFTFGVQVAGWLARDLVNVSGTIPLGSGLLGAATFLALWVALWSGGFWWGRKRLARKRATYHRF